MVDLTALQDKYQEYCNKQLPLYIEEVINICQIPAPSYQEKERAEYLAERLKQFGLNPVIDDIYNVIAHVPANSQGKPAILFAAHTDTVFPIETDVTVRKEGSILHAPGVGDNSSGVAGLIFIAKALQELNIEHGDLYLAGTVCEEGLGDLKGMKRVFAELKDKIDYVIAIDGGIGGVVHGGIGSKRLRVKVSGPGGHSYGSFGSPSAIHSLGKMISAIASLHVPELPRTTYNVGVISGGTSINTIAAQAEMLIDMRSEADKELEKLVNEVNEILNRVAKQDQVKVEVTVVGDRPGGHLSAEHRLVEFSKKVLQHLGFGAESHSGSTDANVPLSQGTPAVCLGFAGGRNAHRPDEWLDPAPAVSGLMQILLLLEVL